MKTKAIIQSYVEKGDINGLAEYFRAYIEDEIDARADERRRIGEIIESFPVYMKVVGGDLTKQEDAVLKSDLLSLINKE